VHRAYKQISNLKLAGLEGRWARAHTRLVPQATGARDDYDDASLFTAASGALLAASNGRRGA